MSKYRTGLVADALKGLDLEGVYKRGGDVALLIDGEAVKATVVGRVDETPFQSLDEVYGYDVWMVFKIGDQYFKRFGYWESHSGRSWSSGRTVEVQAKQKVVEYYE